MANISKIELPDGVTYDIKDLISGYTDTPVMSWYGTSSTTASTAEKVVTCANFNLVAGAVIGVLFSTANTAATPTLNVNSTGAKSIYVGSSVPSSTTNVLKWSANTLIYFLYDGAYFRYIISVASASVAQPRGANTWYGTSSTSATTAAKVSTITNFVLTIGAIVSVTFSTANTYSGAITLNVNSTGAKTIYYNNAATSTTNLLPWDAGETLTFIYTGSYYYCISKTKPLTAGASDGTKERIPNVMYGSTSPTGTATTGTVYFQTGSSAYTFQPRVNLTGLSANTTISTWTSFTLPKGLYLITFQVNSGAISTYVLRVDLMADSDTITQVRTGAANASNLILNGAGLVECTESTTIYFKAQTSSNSVSNCELHYSYVKLF